MVKEKSKQKRERTMANICVVIGILCLIYFILIALLGYGTYFFVIWGMMGAVLLGMAYGLKRGWISSLPAWLRIGGGSLILIGIVVFLLIEGCILSGFSAKGKENLDYLIVLGAQLKQSGPSRTLKMRLDAAYKYAMDNTDTIVIVSGGQGSDEPDTEAQGMYDYLVEKGLDASRIIREDESVNTHENLIKSNRYLDKSSHTVGIVTSNFHIFRAKHLAKAAGYQQVYGLSAPSEVYMLPNNMLREGMAVVKDFLVGNLG